MLPSTKSVRNVNFQPFLLILPSLCSPTELSLYLFCIFSCSVSGYYRAIGRTIHVDYLKESLQAKTDAFSSTKTKEGLALVKELEILADTLYIKVNQQKSKGFFFLFFFFISTKIGLFSSFVCGSMGSVVGGTGEFLSFH